MKTFYFEERDNTIRCVDCNRPIKKKLVKGTNGKANRCYCCNNIKKGKTEVDRHKLDKHTGQFVKVKTVNFKKLQEQNRKKFGWYNTNKGRQNKYKKAY